MYEAVRDRIGGGDAAIFCAAVADYRPKRVSELKIKKSSETLTLELEKTEDILGSARAPFGFDGILVGFAAETDHIEEHARAKLRKKGCDLIVANDVSRPGMGFESDHNEVRLFFTDGHQESIGRGTKSEIGQMLVEIIEGLVEAAES